LTKPSIKININYLSFNLEYLKMSKLQLTFDPTQLTQHEKEDLCAFILGFGKPSAPSVIDKFDLPDVGVNPSVFMQQLGRVERHVQADEASAAFGLAEPILTTPTLPVTDNKLYHQGEEVGGVVNAEVTISTDKSGLPWDARIHSDNRALNADGTWRKRRGVTDDVFFQVANELRAAKVSVPLPPATVATVATPPATVATPPATVATPPATVDIGALFRDIIKQSQEPLAAGKITQQGITDFLLSKNFKALPLLPTEPEKMAAAHAAASEFFASL
jgi:hypothetical protein